MSSESDTGSPGSGENVESSVAGRRGEGRLSVRAVLSVAVEILLLPVYILFWVYDWLKRAIKGLPSTKWLLAELAIAENEVFSLVVEANTLTRREESGAEGDVLTDTEIEDIRWKLKLPLIKYDFQWVYDTLPFGYQPEYWDLDEKEWTIGERTIKAVDEVPEQLSDVTVPGWAYTAMESLYEAHIRAALGDTEEGLRRYFAARRQMLRGRVALRESAMGVVARTMLKEVSDMPDSWRKTRIVELLEGAIGGGFAESGPEAGGGEVESASAPDSAETRLERVLEARGLMDEFYLNQYGRIANLRMYLLTFVIFAVVLGGVILLYAHMLPMPDTETVPEVAGFDPMQFYALILAFGGLGATISGIRTVQLSTDSPRALGSILGLWLPLARLVMGAISALLLVLLLLAGFVTTAYINLGVIVGLAFASGFSERLLLQAVRSFETASTRRATA